MKTQTLFAAAFFVAALPALSGCASYDNMSEYDKRRMTGQVVGGVTGAALGSLVGGGTGKAIAIGAGAVVGGIVGGEVANH